MLLELFIIPPFLPLFYIYLQPFISITPFLHFSLPLPTHYHIYIDPNPHPRSIDTNPSISTILTSPSWRSSFIYSDLVPQRGSTRLAACFAVPYSEHSSFRELTLFACGLRIGKIVPTVNVGSAASRAKMKGWIDKWQAERRKAGGVVDVSGKW